MDNPLTPNKIQRLMHLAEDKSFHLARRGLPVKNETPSVKKDKNKTTPNKTGTNYESSSGILDLEQIEVFGESGLGNMSFSKSNVFNPGELTGRSTGAEDENIKAATREFEEYGRHSVAIDSITSHMDKQTSEINDIMRHSIATNYSFHSKRDLTADEASLVMREAPLPIQHSTQLNFHESMLMSNTNMSVGAYFKNRCPEFGKILANVDSPDRPSITEASSAPTDVSQGVHNNTYQMDHTLDCVPVKQPRAKTEKIPDRSLVTNLFPKNEANFIPAKTHLDVSNVKQDKGVNKSSAAKGNQSISQKTFKSSKPTDVLLRNLQSSLRMVTEDTECSTENSLSISKIADYLGKQSNVSVTDILQLNNKRPNTKPLAELPVKSLETRLDNKTNIQDLYVTSLKDTKGMDVASSSGTVNTVISLEKLKICDEKVVPSVVVTRHSLDPHAENDVKFNRIERSNSPSSKSWSTLSTVQENVASFKSDSPMPTGKEKWADITVAPVQGFVGVVMPVTISVTTLTDSWLTAKFEFDSLIDIERYLTVELPRLPLLLSPGKTEKFTLHITSNVEIDSQLPFTMYLKDASVDGDIQQKGCIDVQMKMPVIQAVSCDGVNKLTFPSTRENSIMTKYFVLISDSPVDLQLELVVVEGDSLFVIKSLQEIKKTDISRALMERQASSEEPKAKGKGKNKQLCRLSSGDAIKVAVTFNSPRLSDLEISEKMVTFKGALNVNLIGVNTLVKKVSLVASVGSADLVIPCSKLSLTNEATTITLRNEGEVTGVWAIKFRGTTTEGSFPFKVSSTKIEINPKCSKDLSLMYTGSADTYNAGVLVFEDAVNGNISTIDINGGQDRVKTFPIKTNYNNMSWVRNERKELSLKNISNKKIQIRCQIVGEGFQIDLPGVESRGSCILTFSACECRPLPIIFSPKSSKPHVATLHLVYDKSSEFSRKIKLHGSSGGSLIRWSALLTYGDTALAQASARTPTALSLYNKGHSAAFVCAAVQFNLQYRFLSGEAQLLGSKCVVRARSKHSLTLRLPWSKLERRARPGSALANVSVLAGPEIIRRRILRILRSESTNGEPDLSLLPEHLHIITHTFEGEDPSADNYLENFSETKASLNELIESLQELSAKIDLPQELPDDNTIVLTDDTVVEHYTLCE
ncbi:uncharacterized protein LOC116771445 isoform X2 [Danaus plexippus]|uniref:uncharacterized protein LOC116771445 isoform X2 n=1 Tax=Danaus plexippus TaxID=13037 RepID=UPI002AB06A19|nr:uncharacterized protein LOC116771445 isoform X2 [Danaus plexippus]